MKKMKGFTLIELLAVITILSIIMIIALPKVIGVIDSGKVDSFISVGTTLQASASLYASTNENVVYPTLANHVIMIEASLLDMGSRKDPDGNTYDLDKTYILIDNLNNYYVTLYSGVSTRGILNAEVLNLNDNSVITHSASTFTPPIAGGTVVIDTDSNGTLDTTYTVDTVYGD